MPVVAAMTTRAVTGVAEATSHGPTGASRATGASADRGVQGAGVAPMRLPADQGLYRPCRTRLCQIASRSAGSCRRIRSARPSSRRGRNARAEMRSAVTCHASVTQATVAAAINNAPGRIGRGSAGLSHSASRQSVCCLRHPPCSRASLCGPLYRPLHRCERQHRRSGRPKCVPCLRLSGWRLSRVHRFRQRRSGKSGQTHARPPASGRVTVRCAVTKNKSR